MPLPLRKQLTMSGINAPTCLKKLKELLGQMFTLNLHQSLPDHMALKGELSSPEWTHEVDLEIFTNERCEIKVSPKLANRFVGICAKIETAFEESIEVVSRGTSVRAMRAGRILEFLRSLSTHNEVNKIVVASSQWRV